MGAVISEDVKIGIRNQTDPTWGGSSYSVSSKNGQIEGLKNGKRKKGALKALIQSAQGSALGHGTSPAISAPCKGNYIKIEGLK